MANKEHDVKAIPPTETERSAAAPSTIRANETSDFIYYPTDKVVGIIDDPDDAEAALSDLEVAGFTVEEIEVLTGEEGAHRIDSTGRKHGVLPRIVRSIQKLGNYESDHVIRHEQELLAGHFGIGVTAKKEQDRERVKQILKAHNGHFINFYGTWAMQRLDA
jgi:hypothetical protein